MPVKLAKIPYFPVLECAKTLFFFICMWGAWGGAGLKARWN